MANYPTNGSTTNSGAIKITNSDTTTVTFLANNKSAQLDNTSTGTITITTKQSIDFYGSLLNDGTIGITQTGATANILNFGTSHTDNSTFLNDNTIDINTISTAAGSSTTFQYQSFTNAGSIRLQGTSNDPVAIITQGFTNKANATLNLIGAFGTISSTAGTFNNGTINITGGNITIPQELQGSNGSVNLNQGTLTLGGSIPDQGGQTYNFTGGDNILTLTNEASNTGTITVRGFSASDQIVVPSVTGAPSYNSSTGILTVGSHAFNIGTGYTGTFSDATGTLSYSATTPCFLVDTIIHTPTGGIPVQDIRVGDHLTTLADGRHFTRIATWVGRSRVTARSADDYPVRIAKNAIANGIPNKDLLVTPEHCLFLDGKLIPARMLVNHRSVRVDRSFRQYNVYHVELEPHAVIIADGAPTESYLDTGNRPALASPDSTIIKGPFARRTWDDAAAPVTVDRATVEPIWHRLSERAAMLGFPAATPPLSLTNDPDLHVLTDTGAIIRPTQHHGRIYGFMVPSAVKSIHLVSRTARPADTIGPFLDDRRTLGVLVAAIHIKDGKTETSDFTHLSAPTLPGWHAYEAGSPGRWTNGHGLLSLSPSNYNRSAVLLEIEVIHAGPYVISQETPDSLVA